MNICAARVVGNAVEQQVPGPPEDMVARQLAAHRRHVPLAAQDRLAVRDRLVGTACGAGCENRYSIRPMPETNRDATGSGSARIIGNDGLQKSLADVEPASFHRRLSPPNHADRCQVVRGSQRSAATHLTSRAGESLRAGQVSRQVGDPA